MKILTSTLLALILAAPVVAHGNHGSGGGGGPSPPAGGPGGGRPSPSSPLRGGGGRGGDHPSPPPSPKGGPHDRPLPPHLQHVVDACKEDNKVYCANAPNVGDCFAANYGCFSQPCIDAVNEALKVEKDHPRPSSPHHGPGGPGGHHQGPPPAVIDACKADKLKFCADTHGHDVIKCMHDHKSELSTVCTDAVAQWVATLPTPPASVVEACSHDAETLCPGLTKFELMVCMREHKDSVSTACKDAVHQAKHGGPTPTTGVTSTTTTSTAVPSSSSSEAPSSSSTDTPSVVGPTNIPVTDSAVVMSALVEVDPTVVPSTTSVPSTGVTSTAAPACTTKSSAAPLAAGSSELVNMAYSGNANAANPPRPGAGRVVGLALGGAAAIFAVVALVITVRRYHARRAAAAAASGSVTTTSNPLAYNTLSESEAVPEVVTGVPINM